MEEINYESDDKAVATPDIVLITETTPFIYKLCAIFDLKYMEQGAFSNIVRDYISKKYPAFLETISYHADGSFDCTIKNAKGKFSVWIATYDSEITLGLQAADGNSDCHTHMSFYGEEPTEQLEAMKNYLEDIFSNKLLFMQSSLSGYSWTNNVEHTLKKKKKTESFKLFRWNES